MSKNTSVTNALAIASLDLWSGIAANAFMWAGFWVMIFSRLLSHSTETGLGETFVAISAVGQVTGIIIAGACFKLLPNMVKSLPLTIFLAITCALVFLVISYDLAASVPWLQFTLLFSFGLTNAFLWVDTATFLARRSIKQIALSLSASSILGAGLVICKMILLPDAGTVFASLFAPISLLLFYFSHKNQSAQAETYHRSTIVGSGNALEAVKGVEKYRKLFFIIPVFGLAFGFSIGASFHGATMPSAIIGLALVIPGLALLVTFYAFKRMINLRTLSAVVLLLTVAAMLPWSIDEGTAAPIRALVIYAAFTLFDLSTVATLMEIGKSGEISSFVSILFGRLLVMLGVTAGMLIVIAVGSNTAGAYEPVVSSILILMLIASFSWFSTGRHMLEANAPLSEQTPFKVAIADIAEEFNLSKRESEVLPFIAKGYNAKHIETELFISNNTVKSHLYRIYGKLNVHTQQEVIKLVDEKVKKYREMLNP